MKKRILIVLLVILMILSVTSCKNDDTEIVGLVTGYNESCCFSIDIIDGFQEDIMQVNMDEK